MRKKNRPSKGTVYLNNRIICYFLVHSVFLAPQSALAAEHSVFFSDEHFDFVSAEHFSLAKAEEPAIISATAAKLSTFFILYLLMGLI